MSENDVTDPPYLWNSGLDSLCIMLSSETEWRGDQELTVDVIGDMSIRGFIGVVMIRSLVESPMNEVS